MVFHNFILSLSIAKLLRIVYIRKKQFIRRKKTFTSQILGSAKSSCIVFTAAFKSCCGIQKSTFSVTYVEKRTLIALSSQTLQIDKGPSACRSPIYKMFWKSAINVSFRT